MFKEFLMKNSLNPDIEVLFKWWNGRVFTFDTDKQGVKTDDVDSGMDEAELVLAGHNFSDNDWDAELGNSQVDNYEEHSEMRFIGNTFDTLTIDTTDGPNQPPSSHTPADPCASSSRCEPLAAVGVQPAATGSETGAQNPTGNFKQPSNQKAGGPRGGKSIGKGKGKAVVFVEAGLEAGELIETEGSTTVSGRNLRSRRK